MWAGYLKLTKAVTTLQKHRMMFVSNINILPFEKDKNNVRFNIDQ